MNRRSFLRDMLIAGIGFTILPGAGRIWKAQISAEDFKWMPCNYEVMEFAYRFEFDPKNHLFKNVQLIKKYDKENNSFRSEPDGETRLPGFIQKHFGRLADTGIIRSNRVRPSISSLS